MKRIYLDYAATTPVDPHVFRAMQPYFSRTFGNSSSLHYFGQRALSAVDDSREAIARSLGADFREIIFTGSATEANNLALRGALCALIQNANLKVQNDNSKFKNSSSSRNAKTFHLGICNLHFRPRIVISAIEHESVLETCGDLEKTGVEVVIIPVDRNGIVDVKKLEKSLNERTVLVSVMYANNEVGAIQPLFEIAKTISNFKMRMFNSKFLISKQTEKLEIGNWKLGGYPLFHTDAAQAFQFLSCVPSELGVDLMTLSAHKIYGPKGVGALYVKSERSKVKGEADDSVEPIITGGGQEFGLRSGTENVPSIVGFGKAVSLAVQYRAREGERQEKLRERFWRGFSKLYPTSERTLPNLSESGFVLPNILNVHVPGVAAEYLVTKFDLAGIAISAGSACSARALRSSHVVEALGFSKARAEQSIRISFGRPTTEGDIDLALRKIKMIT